MDVIFSAMHAMVDSNIFSHSDGILLFFMCLPDQDIRNQGFNLLEGCWDDGKEEECWKKYGSIAINITGIIFKNYIAIGCFPDIIKQ